MTYLLKLDTAKGIVEVADVSAASRHLLAEQDRIGYQGPDDHSVWPRGGKLYAVLGGPVVAHVSQNGRVWEGEKWTPATKLLSEASM